MVQYAERYGEQVLSPEWEAERQRLELMGEVCDPVTIGVLRARGVGPGWRCLEVGAGGGSIAAWLAQAVSGRGSDGKAGHVTATDIDVRHLIPLTGPTLTVLEHDVVHDPLPEAAFDLIHARFVLEHLPEREAVLDKMVTWLAPGGLLILESLADFPVPSASHPAFATAMTAVAAILNKTIGTDTAWAHTFPTPLRTRGLTDLGAQVFIPATGGTNASARFWALTLEQLTPHILQAELADADTLRQAQELLADPDFFDFGHAAVIGWGRFHPQPQRRRRGVVPSARPI